MASEFPKGHTISQWQGQDCQTPKAFPGLLPHQTDWGYILFYYILFNKHYIVSNTVFFRHIQQEYPIHDSPRGIIQVLSVHHSPLAAFQPLLPPRPLNTNQPRLVWISLQKVFLLLNRTLMPLSILWTQVMGVT